MQISDERANLRDVTFPFLAPIQLTHVSLSNTLLQLIKILKINLFDLELCAIDNNFQIFQLWFLSRLLAWWVSKVNLQIIRHLRKALMMIKIDSFGCNNEAIFILKRPFAGALQSHTKQVEKNSFRSWKDFLSFKLDHKLKFALLRLIVEFCCFSSIIIIDLLSSLNLLWNVSTKNYFSSSSFFFPTELTSNLSP